MPSTRKLIETRHALFYEKGCLTRSAPVYATENSLRIWWRSAHKAQNCQKVPVGDEYVWNIDDVLGEHEVYRNNFIDDAEQREESEDKNGENMDALQHSKRLSERQ